MIREVKRQEIPKRIFFFWCSNSMSWMRWLSLASFRRLNPDWQVDLYLCKPNKVNTKTWKDYNKQDFFNFDGRNYLMKVQDLGINLHLWDLDQVGQKGLSKTVGAIQKSDLFRWQKLAQQGGIYADTDILFTRPIDEYYETIKNQDTVLCYRNRYFLIGLMASAPGNQFFSKLFAHGITHTSNAGYQAAGVCNLYKMLNSYEPM